MKTIEQLLRGARNVAIVGMSDKPERASHEVGAYLQQQGYRILPVNPAYAGTQILGETVHATLQEAADALARDGQHIDIVDVFRKAEDVPPIARDAIDVRAGALWMQLGIENRAAADLARAAGLDVVMNHCMLIEHRRLAETA
ncbi:CoA-binding protein [uncultured Massilia sp.]|uniref:CoA-binding protein n=1 Tax=uncultured Massilia sp. TaxID=169973 RepID=UPI0025E15D01|nr:CoA-binding protein [uncultured Massilia sp.]